MARPKSKTTLQQAQQAAKSNQDGSEILKASDKIRAELCLTKFSNFLRTMWPAVCAEELHWNWHLDVMCAEVQAVAERALQRVPSPYDLILNVPPGSTKSLTVSVMLPAWCLARDTAFRTICSSYAFDLSLDLSLKCRDVVQHEFYQRLFPWVQLRKDQLTKQYFMTTGKGYRYVTSTGGTITVFHGHLLIVDNPIDPKGAISDALLGTTNEWLSSTLSSRKVDKSNTPTILVMQRLAQGDPTGHWLETKQGRLRHICLPAEIGNENAVVKPEKLRNMYQGNLLDEKRLPRATLDFTMEELGLAQYSSQYLENPIPPGGLLFDTDNFDLDHIVDHLPAGTTVVREVRYWDKAATEAIKNPKACYTVGTRMWLLSNGAYLVRDVVRGRWATDKREGMMRITAERDGTAVPVVLEEEGGSAGKDSSLASVKNLAGFTVLVERPTGNKELRADPFSVQVNKGNVYLWRANWNLDFITEHRWFPKGKYKDQVDSASAAFTYLARMKRVGTW